MDLFCEPSFQSTILLDEYSEITSFSLFETRPFCIVAQKDKISIINLKTNEVVAPLFHESKWGAVSIRCHNNKNIESALITEPFYPILWDIEYQNDIFKPRIVKSFDFNKVYINDVQWVNDSNFLTGDKEGNLFNWDIRMSHAKLHMFKSSSPISKICVHPLTKSVSVLSSNSIEIFDFRNGSIIQQYKPQADYDIKDICYVDKSDALYILRNKNVFYYNIYNATETQLTNNKTELYTQFYPVKNDNKLCLLSSKYFYIYSLSPSISLGKTPSSSSTNLYKQNYCEELYRCKVDNGIQIAANKYDTLYTLIQTPSHLLSFSVPMNSIDSIKRSPHPGLSTSPLYIQNSMKNDSFNRIMSGITKEIEEVHDGIYPIILLHIMNYIDIGLSLKNDFEKQLLDLYNKIINEEYANIYIIFLNLQNLEIGLRYKINYSTSYIYIDIIYTYIYSSYINSSHFDVKVSLLHDISDRPIPIYIDRLLQLKLSRKLYYLNTNIHEKNLYITAVMETKTLLSDILSNEKNSKAMEIQKEGKSTGKVEEINKNHDKYICGPPPVLAIWGDTESDTEEEEEEEEEYIYRDDNKGEEQDDDEKESNTYLYDVSFGVNPHLSKQFNLLHISIIKPSLKIYMLSEYININKTLIDSYSLSNFPTMNDLCTYNLNVCRLCHYTLLEDIWGFLLFLLDDQNDNTVSWGTSSLIHDIIMGILNSLIYNGDLSSLAYVCYVFQYILTSLYPIYNDLYFSPSPSYSSLPKDGIQSISASSLNQIQSKCNTNPLTFIDGYKQYKEIYLLLNNCIHQYADILDRLKLYTQKVAILNPFTIIQEDTYTTPLQYLCCYCEQPITGLFLLCQKCGHVFHTQHAVTWFSQYSTCPSGCGCECGLSNASSVSSPTPSLFSPRGNTNPKPVYKTVKEIRGNTLLSPYSFKVYNS
ncbi:hypothetical protein WA158_002667 [Blastocystis sp. Blastoise]